MLSLYTIKSADASKYYEQGDYYASDKLQASNTLWLGKGAALLQLEGSVDPHVFKKMLEGHLPNGSSMPQAEKGCYHRPGYDLTFSAPKSVSILALVATYQTILEAHRRAVQKTIQKLELDYAACRVKEKGQVRIESTGNYIVATFEHYDSREGDPNLHTHCVFINATQKENGSWRAIYGDDFYTHVLKTGRVYNEELYNELISLQFKLDEKKNSNFEIRSVPKEVIRLYSKRRIRIQDWLVEKGLSGSKAAEKANFFTRKAKSKSKSFESSHRWKNELQISGFNLETLYQKEQH